MENYQEIAKFLGELIVMCFIVCKTVKAGLNKYLSYSPKTSVKLHNEVDMEIQQRLDDVRDLFNADSARIHLVHNGSHYIGGVSSLKVNCAYEVLKFGTKSSQVPLMEMPVTISAPFIDKLLKHTIINCRDIERCEGLCESQEFCDTRLAAFKQVEKDICGNEALNAILLTDKNREPIGFITIGYINKDNFTMNDGELYRLAEFIEDKLSMLAEKDNERKNTIVYKKGR